MLEVLHSVFFLPKILMIMVVVFVLTYWVLFDEKHAGGTRKFIAEWLDRLIESGRLKSYQWALDGLLQKADTYLGDITTFRGWAKGYFVCFFLAFLYPIAFFVLGYGLFQGSHHLSGIPLLPDFDLWGRRVVFLSIVVIGVLSWWIGKNEIAWQIAVQNRSTLLFWLMRIGVGLGLATLVVYMALEGGGASHLANEQPDISLSMGLLILLILLLLLATSLKGYFFVAFVSAGYFGFLFTGTVVSAIVFATIIPVLSISGIAYIRGYARAHTIAIAARATDRAVTFAFTRAIEHIVAHAIAYDIPRSFAIAIAIVIVSVVISAFLGFADITTIMFFLVLPLANSVFDLLSLQLSRFFIKNIASASFRIWARIITEIVLDIVGALFFLVALAFALIWLIQLMNGYWIDDPYEYFVWQEHVKLVVADPFGEGFMTTAMLFSTLLPTFVHVVIGLAALLWSILRLAPGLHRQLKNYDDMYDSTNENKYKLVNSVNHGWVALQFSFCFTLPLVLIYFLYKLATWGVDKLFDAQIGNAVLWVVDRFPI